MSDASTPPIELFDRLSTWAEVQALVDRKEPESETLEYKSGHIETSHDRDPELSKDVSAFANSGGGVIIFGIPPVKDKKANQTFPGAPDFIEARKMETLQTIIPDRARHPIAGIRFNVVPKSDREAVLVVHVPQSGFAPHQARDHKYYRRQGASSVSMAHDLVELYFGRRSQAILEPPASVLTLNDGHLTNTVLLPLSFTNAGGAIGRDVYVRLEFVHRDLRLSKLEMRSGTSHTKRELPSGLWRIDWRHPAWLFYPRVAEHAGSVIVQAQPQCAGRHVGPLAHMDVYADGSVPRRYSAHIAVGEYERNAWVWEHVGLPPVHG